MIKEIWKPLSINPERYSVSNLGNFVGNLSRWGERDKPRPLKPRLSGGGYLYVAIFNGSSKSRRDFAVHRILATEFIPNPRGLKYVNHIDGNPLNNSLDNLEWVEFTENIRHALVNGLKKTNLSQNQVFAIRELLKLKTISQPRIAAIFGVHPTTICQINTGTIYHWVGKDYHQDERDVR